MNPRLRPWIELVRLPAVFSVWSNIIAAHLIATLGQPQLPLLGLQLGISTCLYWAGMILNDCFDLAEDRQERPGRPLPSGRIRPAAAWAAGFGLLGLGLGLGALAGGAILLVSLLLAGTVLAYDGGLKQGPLGPVAMGSCRGLNWLLGLAAAPLVLPQALLALPVLLYTMAVTVLARAETRDGDRAAVWHAGLWVAATAALLLGLHLAGPLHGAAALTATALAAGLMLYRLVRLAADPGGLRVRATVGQMLLGMIPLDALLLAGAGHWPAALGLLLLLLPGRLLVRRIAIT